MKKGYHCTVIDPDKISRMLIGIKLTAHAESFSLCASISEAIREIESNPERNSIILLEYSNLSQCYEAKKFLELFMGLNPEIRKRNDLFFLTSHLLNNEIQKIMTDYQFKGFIEKPLRDPDIQHIKTLI